MVQVKKLEVEVDPEARRVVAGLLDAVLPPRYHPVVPVVVLAGGLLATVLWWFLGISEPTPFCLTAWNVSCVRSGMVIGQ